MEILRTPEYRFDEVPDFPYPAHYVEVPTHDASGTQSLRVHFLDVGPAEGQVVVLLHGEPSWSFLYRSMIPVLAEAGLRCIAPDLVGFGKSDKPAGAADYTFARHVQWMRHLLFDELGLGGVTLFGQDWGSLIGLRLVGEHPDRFARVVIANGGLPTGDQDMPEAFHAWQDFARNAALFPVGGIVQGGTVSHLSEAVVAAYDAPFPDESFKAGARIFPSLVPTSPDNPASAANRAAWEVLSRFNRPFLTAFSDSDPITRGGAEVLRRLVPGAAGQRHPTIEGAGHFLQEDKGPELAVAVRDFIAAT